MNSINRSTTFLARPRLTALLVAVVCLPGMHCPALAGSPGSAPAVSADEPAGETQPEQPSSPDSPLDDQPHAEATEANSAIQDLAYAAVRVPAAEDILRRLPEGSLPESTFDVLHEIFSLTDDAFLADPASGRWLGLRQSALQRLRQAGFSTQQAWNRTAIAAGQTAWEDAVRRGDAAAAASIASAWPLSEFELRLTLLQALEAWHAGESAAADAAVARVLDRCRGTFLESRAASLLLPLQHRLQSSLVPAANQTPQGSVPPVSAPWPRPLWRWMEQVRQQDAERQQAESTLLLSLNPDTSARMRSVELWKPLLWGPWVVCRAPSRLVALDRSTGKECWWLNTDPALRDPNAPHHEDDSGEVLWRSSPANQSGVIDLRQDTRWGVFAADAECLWLVDRMPVLNGLDPQALPFTRGRLNPWLPDELQPDTANIGTRLVCLRRPQAQVSADASPAGSVAPDNAAPPYVAWVLGDGSLEYQISTPASSLLNPSTPAQVAVSGSPPHDSRNSFAEPSSEEVESGTDTHRQLFSSGPAVHENRLVILSESPETEQLEVHCLNRLTGQLIWRQPLLQSNMLHTLRAAAGGSCQSMCLIRGNSVICSLEGSVLAAVDLWDGHCRWMLPLTRLRSTDATAFPALFDALPFADGIPTRCPFFPVANEQLILCTAPGSADLQAVDVETGNVIWKVSRLVSGFTGPGGSPDLLAAGVFTDQVILIGDRHCRSLELATGAQRWVVETGLCGGMPLCSPGRLVLPQLDGCPLVIDLSRGRRVEQSELFLPHRAGDIFGALAGDEHRIFSGTSGAILAWPRADAVAADSVVPPDSTAGRQRSTTQQLQALLLNGDIHAAADFRRKHQLPAELLSEAWLLEHGSQLEATPSMTAAESVPLPPDLALSPSQQLRLELMQAAASGQLISPGNSDLDNLLQLSSARSVSPAVLRSRRLPQPTDAPSLQTLTLAELRRFAESACVHPAACGSPEDLDLLVVELLRRGLPEAAELVAAAWWLEASPRQGQLSGAAQATQRLQESRGGMPVKRREPPLGLQSDSAGTLTAIASLALRSTDAAAADPEGEDLPQAVPWWLPCDARLAVASENGRSLLLLDRAGAGLLAQFPRDSGWNTPSVSFQQTSRLLSAPGIVPVLDNDRLQMMSLRADGSLKSLWTHKLPGIRQAVPEPQFGPLWPGGLILHANDTLLCLHPLTGRQLWTRRLPQETDYSGILSARVFGDHRAVVVLGGDGASFESFQAHDGRCLGRGAVQIGRGTECGTVGRHLICTDFNYQLHVLDGATGNDVLQQQPPVNIARTHTENLFSALPGNRILTITDVGELVLIDLHSGTQVFRTRLPPAETMAAVSSLEAVENGDRLLVKIENIGVAAAGGFGAVGNLPFRQQAGFGMLGMGIGEELRKPPRGAAFKIDDGLLCCLDAASGKLLWIQPRYDCRLHLPAGDPTDLLVITQVRFGREQTLDGGLAQYLNAEVLHAQSGAVLLQAGKIAMSGIHAVWHDAAAREIRLIGTDGTVVLRESAEPR